MNELNGDDKTLERCAIDAWNTRAERTCADVGKPAYFKCSECGWVSTVFSFGEGMPVYCPSCGAKVVR